MTTLTVCRVCACGCGRETPLATRNRAESGLVKGQPVRYVNGHGPWCRPVKHLPEDRGYDTPCWIWQLRLDQYGYGHIRVGDRANVPAHRHMYEQHVGPIPEGLQIDHLCRVRECVNPDHLEPVTPRENSRRGVNTRLTEEQVRAIHSSDLKGVELARIYGMSEKTISKIKLGRRPYTWVV